MFRKTTAKLLLTTTLVIAILNTVDSPHLNNSQLSWLNLEQTAQARSTGGRSGGGSFSRGSSGSSSSGRSSSGSRSRPSQSNSRSRTPSYSSPSTSSSTYSSGGYSTGGVNSNPMGTAIFFGILFFGVSGIIVFAVVSSVLKGMFNVATSSNSPGTYSRERDNDIVTISQLQVALLASATGVQSGLSELSLGVDTSTESGLRELLQESVLILLRHSEYWSHALVNSEKIQIEQAESRFSQLSLEQRSKLSEETLTNIKGRVQQRNGVTPEAESAMYIVVTLLVGTAHDHPLFDNVKTIESLKTALEALATTPDDYLLKFELIWSPQTETDSLTYDEFITEYTQMVQLI